MQPFTIIHLRTRSFADPDSPVPVTSIVVAVISDPQAVISRQAAFAAHGNFFKHTR